MPRVTHVKSARKDNPVCKKGESYYWWKFRYGGKRYSLTRPRPSQLTQSAYYGAVRALAEMIEDADPTDGDEFESLKEEVRDELQNIGSECQDSLDNMPEQLQYAPTGELLQERVDACEMGADEAECVDEFDFEEEEFIREPFDESDFDHEDDIEAEEAAHEKEQDELEADHEGDEEERRGSEFSEWLDNAKNELLEAVANCEV